jgi:hypothetical protein
MTEEQASYIKKMKIAIDDHVFNGNRALASRMKKVVVHLPHNLSGAIAAVYEGELDSYLILELKQTFSV